MAMMMALTAAVAHQTNNNNEKKKRTNEFDVNIISARCTKIFNIAQQHFQKIVKFNEFIHK